MTDFYPKGAIQTCEELTTYLGADLYHVYGFSGKTAPEPQRMVLQSKDARFTNLGFSGKERWTPFWKFKHFSRYGNYTTENSSGDMNIGSRNGYNEHFLFTNFSDAYAYAKWVQENLPPMRSYDSWMNY